MSGDKGPCLHIKHGAAQHTASYCEIKARLFFSVAIIKLDGWNERTGAKEEVKRMHLVLANISNHFENNASVSK